MTNVIQSFSHASTAQATNATSTADRLAAKPAQQAEANTDVESVTLSTAAQTNAALLGAAHNANGIDQSHVSAIKAALANGTYNVSPEDLAGAISAVLNEAKG